MEAKFISMIYKLYQWTASKIQGRKTQLLALVLIEDKALIGFFD